MGGGFTHAESLLLGLKKYGSSANEFIVLSENEIKLPFVQDFKHIWVNQLETKKSWGRKKKVDLVEYLKKEKVDLILLSQPHTEIIPEYPFVAFNWDLAHITTYNFPEIKRSLTIRQEWYENTLPKALSIFVESNAGKKELINYLNIPDFKIKIVPLFPSTVIDTELSDTQEIEILDQLQLNKHFYFFYPAQFWALKNHITLVKAFKKINELYPNYKLVFTGSDKGNLSHVKQKIKELELEHTIKHLGFVEYETLKTLYQNAKALVFPTLLGPTNIPILEAIHLNCPVICSNFEGHKEQLQEAALYCNPLDEADIFNKMESLILDENLRLELISLGKSQNKKTQYNLISAIKILELNLSEIANIRALWP
jgi:glycosyltransferase involved in cell wall biosynthesis